MKLAICKRHDDEDPVLSNQSLTPSDMMDMYLDGQPISSAALQPVSSNDESTNPSWEIPINDRPNVEPSEIFEHSRKSQKKISDFGKKSVIAARIAKYNSKKDDEC